MLVLKLIHKYKGIFRFGKRNVSLPPISYFAKAKASSYTSVHINSFLFKQVEKPFNINDKSGINLR